MAFFGLFGYTKNTYLKNTAKFTARINDIICSVKSAAAGKVLGDAVRALALCSDNPGTYDIKALESIDARIEGLIDKISADAKCGNTPMLKAHANILLSAICQARFYGKEKRSQRHIELEELIEESRAYIEELLTHKTELKVQMNDMLEKLRQAATDGSESERPLRMEYAELEEQMKSIDSKLMVYQENQKSYVEELQSYELKGIYGINDGLDNMKPFKPFPKKIDAEHGDPKG